MPIETPDDATFANVPAGLGPALVKRGFTALTPVQQAVLDPALAGRDLRVSSQTGSGKTVAIGFVLAAQLELPPVKTAASIPPPPPSGTAAARPMIGARPGAILVAPTRELAAQVARELTWLLEPIGARVCTVVGGTSVSAEIRSLKQMPRVVVGTPGRLVDHLERGSIDATGVIAVVLDEADQMLDLGFREELQMILGATPADRVTHLVSATFPREVISLADRYQRDAVRIEGTAHGKANADIDHVAHLVRLDERNPALVNLLLMAPTERALVFVRTRAAASDIADTLSASGFAARPLHGELEQWERTKTLGAFRGGGVSVLVATDVAARGLDVPDVSRVIHADPPGDSDAYTHRSGRTGRAGRKGTSVLLVPPAAREHVLRILQRARVEATWRPAPSASDVRRSADERLRAELAAPAADAPRDPALLAFATELLATMDPTELVAALVGRARRAGPCEPMEVTALEPPAVRRQAPARGPAAPGYPPGARPPGPHTPGPSRSRATEGSSGAPVSFVPFKINWGQRHGADARRLLALVCRRGGVQSGQIGAIRVGPVASTVEVATPAAAEFAKLVKRPDTRDPRIRIEPVSPASIADRPPQRRRVTTA